MPLCWFFEIEERRGTEYSLSLRSVWWLIIGLIGMVMALLGEQVLWVVVWAVYLGVYVSWLVSEGIDK